MAGIGANLFYRKKLIPCVPSNNKDSDGSSESDNECEDFERSQVHKKKTRRACLVEVPEESDDSESSQTSTSRWSKKGRVNSSIVIPESEPSTLSTVSSTCISPANISSPSGSVSTLPPSPSTVRRLKELKNNSEKSREETSSKPSTTVQDCCKPNSSARAPTQLSRTQPDRTQPPRTQTHQTKTKVTEPSGRAKKIFGAAFSNGPLSDLNSNNNNLDVLSPQKKAKEISGTAMSLKFCACECFCLSLKLMEPYCLEIMKPDASYTPSSSLLLSSSPDTPSQSDKGESVPANRQRCKGSTPSNILTSTPMASPQLSPVTPASGTLSFLNQLKSKVLLLLSSNRGFCACHLGTPGQEDKGRKNHESSPQSHNDNQMSTPALSPVTPASGTLSLLNDSTSKVA
ncbi:uncharacterized protein LOC127751161 [Frankliniella occidentalis]|uniref:Uncharacterized protein LOC127751161 n=1 Tax=Frankliniella occidentalis TaxID=133901 RepID=A0A9C6X6T4_FRAOC|nr:uncharacterized protein LOC127751161 [Frankliniella occidentalis]